MSLPSRAGHSSLAAAEVGYKALTQNGLYSIHLNLYHFCDGLGVCSGTCSTIGNCKQAIKIVGASAGFVGTVFTTIYLNGVSVQDANTGDLCSSIKTSCTNLSCVTPGTFTGIERYRFESSINLNQIVPSGCCRVSFVFEAAFAFGLVQNIIINPENGMYAETQVDRCLSSNTLSSSPVQSTDLIKELCANQPVSTSFLAHDYDGDSLSYTLVNAKAALNNTYSYNAPYSGSLPLPYTPPLSGPFPSGFSFNSTTAELRFKPNVSPFLGLLQYRIDEWRNVNGIMKKIGSVNRYVYFRIYSCSSNAPPTMQSFPGGSSAFTPKTIWEVETGAQLCFTVVANDTDSLNGDSTFLSIDTLQLPAGLTFLPTYASGQRQREDSYQLCWTPTENQAGSGYYMINIQGRDNRCPIMGTVKRTFLIKVNPKIKITKTIECDKVTLSHNYNSSDVTGRTWRVSMTPNIFDVSNFKMSNLASPAFFFNQTGRFPVELTLYYANSNPETFYDTLIISKAIKINDDIKTCQVGTTALLQPSNADSGFIIRYWYKLPDLLNPIDSSGSLQIKVAGKQQYLFMTRDTSTTCYYRDTITVQGSNLKISMQVSSTQQCFSGHQFSFTASALDSGNENPVSSWYFSDSTSDYMNDTLVKKFSKPGTYTAAYRVFSSFTGCADSIVKVLHVFPEPTAKFKTLQDHFCVTKPLQMINESTIESGAMTYAWNLGDSDTASSMNITHTYHTHGRYTITLVCQSDKNCLDTFAKTVDALVSPKPKINAPYLTRCQNLPFTFINASTIDSGNTVCNWYAEDFSVSGDTIQHTFTKPGTYPIRLIVVSDISGCFDSSATVNVQVNPIPNALAISGDTVSPKLSLRSYAVSNTPGSVYHWSVMYDKTLKLNSLPEQSNTVQIQWGNTLDWGKVAVYETNSSSCSSDSAFMHIRLTPGTGLPQPSSSSDFTVYPQPASNELYIQGNTKKLIRGELISIIGQTMRVYSGHEIQSGKLNTVGLKTGVYFLEMKDESGNTYVKRVELVNP